MSKTAAELLLEMDAKATPGRWWWDDVPLPGVSERALAVLIKSTPGDRAILRHEASRRGCEWEPKEGDRALIVTLRNALPQLAAVCAAAEKMRANAFGGPCPCESPVCTSLRAFDAALADLTAALSSGGRHARA